MANSTVHEFQIGKSKAQHGLIIGTVCVAMGLAIMLFAGEGMPDRYWIGALVMVLGAGVGFHGWRTNRPAGTHLRIDQNGIYFREWGLTAPWSAIEDVYQTGSRLLPFVTIKIGQPRQFVDSLDEAEARGLRRNRLWKQPELRIPYNAVAASRDELLSAIEAGMKEYGRSPAA